MPLVLLCLMCFGGYGWSVASAQMVPVDSAAAVNGPEISSSASPAPTGFPGVAMMPASANPGSGTGVQLPPSLPKQRSSHIGPFSTVALGVTGSTLGAGVELATPLSRSLNLRVKGTYFDFQIPFTIDGLNYNTAMKLTSGQGLVDWYPKGGGFHISAGALYFKNAIGATADVDPGQQFKLGDTTYTNSVDDPVQGSASLKFQRKVAPMMLFGFGNLIPRSGRHISVPFEFGGAYLAPPVVALQIAGTACTTQGCFNAATDPAVQANRAKESGKLNRDIRPLQVYPILSIGLALRY